MVWEDTKTMGRYLKRKGKLFWRKDSDSRMIGAAEEFAGPIEAEFIPLREEDLQAQIINAVAQPAESPGVEGSGIPSIEHFSNPSPELSSLFKIIYFNTDQHILREKGDYELISRMADYMKKNPKMYVFISGHCDERASEAYNLSLGTRRANAIRSLLVKNGVSANHIYTVSFGKEMPVDLRHNPDAWAKNRRVEFKLFKKE